MTGVLTVLGWLRSALGFVVRYPTLCALIVAVTFAAGSLHWGMGQRNDKRAALQEIVKQRAEFVAASEAAKAKQIALNIAAENKSALIARKADADKQSALRSLADRYRDANRVPASCRPIRTGETAKVGPAGSGDSPGEAAELYVAVSSNDYEILVENSLRLERVRQWGEELVTAKLAIPSAQFGR